MTVVASLDLRGAGGEPVDLRRTLLSHGVAELPPVRVDAAAGAARITLATTGGPRTVLVAPEEGRAVVTALDRGPRPTAAQSAEIAAVVRRMLRLDDDLSLFYARCAGDPGLEWARRGAGRLLRSPTVFEDVVKTVCTTNCAWSATERMVAALVRELGEPAPGATAGEVAGHAFPTPHAMASAGADFYREEARAGYRGAYLRAIAAQVDGGELDLEELLTRPRSALPDDEVERRLLALPGVGPYAAAHVMLLLGRHSRLVLDSWTRPRYALLSGRPGGRLVADRTIARRFRRYGDDAGLAFWLVLTRDWVDDETPPVRR